MSTMDVHDFHFIIGQDMKEMLMDVKIFNDSRGFSGIIVGILKLLSPIVKKEHKWGKQRLSKYKTVCADIADVREHAHVYLPVELYRELKLIHQDLNFYSIAQMVREFMGWFLGFMDGCRGGDVLMELKRVFSQWTEEEAKSRLTLGEYMRQLFRVIQHLPETQRLVTIYNKDFMPFWIFRM